MADSSKVCHICSAEFSTVATKNRHLRNIHQQIIISTPQKSHIICPLCADNELICGTYAKLEAHLQVEHAIKVEVETHNFTNQESHQNWFQSEKLEMTYVYQRRTNCKDYEAKYYFCNRSNTKGFESKGVQRIEKAGGSIKMYGVCPSRIETKIFQTGQTISKFWKTHVGHEDEMRNKHLSKLDKEEIVQKLCDGVTVDRIISDARKVNSEKLQRINLLDRRDVSHLVKKHNITKRKHENPMVAVNLKVKEWNENGKNYCFFYKQQGEHHPVLDTNDFCVGFMNADMEQKLKDSSRIVCMDGTHCTNQKGMDLTIMLVKDDRNMGFPVAFYLSSRLDQKTQEVFIQALREKVGVIQPEYFMSDDDPKYYNAWIKIMGTTPRRLLCSWHIMKNWISQGRHKIRDEEIKKTMKGDMSKILNETVVHKFQTMSQNYFQKLENSGEQGRTQDRN